MTNSVKDRSVIVTGAGRGIGATIARGLADAGAKVSIADIDLNNAKSVAQSITDKGGTAIAVNVDVVDRASVKTMIAETVRVYGRLDVIFNNAGIAQVRKFLDITEADWTRVMDVNGLGVLIGI